MTDESPGHGPILSREQWLELTEREGMELVAGRPMTLRDDPDAERIAAELLRLLTAYAEERECHWVFDPSCAFVLIRDEPRTVRRPRIAVVRRERLHAEALPPSESEQELAPDVVVEVVGPADRAEALETKVDGYLEAGTRLVWVVHPATRAVRVHREDGSENLLHESDDLQGEDILPGFSCSVGRLFPPGSDADGA